MSIKIKSIQDISSEEILFDLWNQEYGYIFPISKQLWERNLQNIYVAASNVAVVDDKVVGFIIGKIWQDDYAIPGYEVAAWISLIYVAPAYRKRGIGTQLLNIAEAAFTTCHKTTFYLGKDYYNFFPGLPVDLKSSAGWFHNRGYEHAYDTYDLMRNKNQGLLPLINQNLAFRFATLQDKEAIIAFLNRCWPGRWTKEAVDYFANGGTGEEYLLCLEQGSICAFAKVGFATTEEKLISYSQTWRTRFESLGGIGPLGVDASKRGHHLGYDIVAYAINVLLKHHVSDIIIDWTGLLDFYRHMGFEVWKSYFYMSKSLKGEKYEQNI